MPQKKRSFAIAASVALLGSVTLPPAQAQEQKEIRIGMKEWAENIAVSNLWEHLLEERGYDVSLTSASRVISFASVASGDLDIDLESWLPATDAALFERYEGQVEVGDEWYDGARLGFVVPDYVELDSVSDLQDPKALEGARSQKIIGIEPGSALMGLSNEALEAYDLERELVPGSEAAMMMLLDRAYETKQPIVVTLWSPHWAFAEYDLKYLDDPKNVFGSVERIHYVMREGFADEFPDVRRWLDAWSMDDQSLGSLMAAVKEYGEDEGVRRWIEDNQALVDSWFEPTS